VIRGRPRKEPPPAAWFDLKKYAGAGDLSIEEWRIQFCARALIGSVQAGDSSAVDELRERVRERGILGASDIPKGYFNSPAPCGIEELTFEEMRERSGNKAFERERAAIGDGYIVVNLRLPLRELQKQFGATVKRMQRSYTADLKKQITPEEWAGLKVLPYIDLQQWAMEAHGKRLPPSVMTRLLFPYKGDRAGGENEDAVRHLAELTPKLLDSRFLLSMRVIKPDEK